MNILLGGGLNMKVSGKSNFWSLSRTFTAMGHEVRAKECLQSGSKADKVKREDVEWADGAVVYSYGASSLWELKKASDKLLHLFSIDGVADAGKGQNKYALWTPPKNAITCVSFNVKDIPVSSPFRGQVKTVGIDSDVAKAIAVNRMLNVDCNGLFAPIMPPGAKHQGIKESNIVLGFIEAFFRGTK